jgi:hypothetical protein
MIQYKFQNLLQKSDAAGDDEDHLKSFSVGKKIIKLCFFYSFKK